jgi:hypothetical protein
MSDVSKLILSELPCVFADSARDLPESAGVYFIVGGDGIVYYIGQSVNLRTRLRKHCRLAQVQEREGLVVRYWLTHRSNLRLLESGCIERFSPVLNGTSDNTPKTSRRKLDDYNQALKDVLSSVAALKSQHLDELAAFWVLCQGQGNVGEMMSLSRELGELNRSEGINLAFQVITGKKLP